jgi:hypothetical protein
MPQINNITLIDLGKYPGPIDEIVPVSYEKDPAKNTKEIKIKMIPTNNRLIILHYLG